MRLHSAAFRTGRHPYSTIPYIKTVSPCSLTSGSSWTGFHQNESSVCRMPDSRCRAMKARPDPSPFSLGADLDNAIPAVDRFPRMFNAIFRAGYWTTAMTLRSFIPQGRQLSLPLPTCISFVFRPAPHSLAARQKQL